jgi:hypothetical protein
MNRSGKADLSKLAIRFMTDKEGDHHYTKHYEHHFQSLRNKRLNILEIGIGGYDNPREGGASLRMWKEYFPNASIFGIDIYDKSPHNEPRIKTFKGSQTDEVFLRKVAEQIGRIDIVIDDGSHINNHVITAFNVLFPLMSPDGIYVVEDLQTSYWEHVVGQDWGGSKSLTASHTSMNFFKSLSDGLNYEEFTLDDYVPSYFDKHIISMHFYHNLVFVYKGLNNEGSNLHGKRDGMPGNVATGDRPPTLAQLEHMVVLKPDNCIAHNALGVLYSQQGNNAKALFHFTKAAATDEFVVAQKNLANLHEALGRHDQAAYQYQRILSRDPNDVDALLGFARLGIEAGRFEGVRHFILRVLENYPDHPEARKTFDALTQWEKDGLIPPSPQDGPSSSDITGVRKDTREQH